MVLQPFKTALWLSSTLLLLVVKLSIQQNIPNATELQLNALQEIILARLDMIDSNIQYMGNNMHDLHAKISMTEDDVSMVGDRCTWDATELKGFVNKVKEELNAINAVINDIYVSHKEMFKLVDSTSLIVNKSLTTIHMVDLEPSSDDTGVMNNNEIEECSFKGGHVIRKQCVIFSGEDDQRTWTSALETCWKNYGTLTSPANPEALLTYTRDNFARTPFWVGGYRLPYEKSFTWLNNTEITENLKWADGQPTAENSSDQRCMLVNYASDYANEKSSYADENCSKPQRYACTLDACGVLGGVTLGHQCLKFRGFDDQLTWENAIDACRSDGGTLVSPAYPRTLLDYLIREYDTRYTAFWVGGLQTNVSNQDSWYWLSGERIPLGEDNFPWAREQPDHNSEHCLLVQNDEINNLIGYNDFNSIDTAPYICEYKTELTQIPPPVPFVITQILSGEYIGPNNVFPYIKNKDPLTLHTLLDINMHMAFDIIDDIWGYIRHIESGKILHPYSGKMAPSDGTRVALHDDRRPWALFALDQYQNRIMHKSGKYIKPNGEFLTISGDESNNKTMEFQFMNTTHPAIEVLPYGYPVVSGDWQLVFSVLNPIATHTYSSAVTVGKSTKLSTSKAFKFGFESETKIGAKASGKMFGIGVEASVEQTFRASLALELQMDSSATWSTEIQKKISFKVEAGNSVAIWQRAYIFEQGENKAVYLSEHFADTNSSRIKPNNFNGSKRRYT